MSNAPVKKDLQSIARKTWLDQVAKYRKDAAGFTYHQGIEGEIEGLRQQMISDHLIKVESILAEPLSQDLISQRKDSIHEVFPEIPDPQYVIQLKILVQKHLAELDLAVTEAESAHQRNRLAQQEIIAKADEEDEVLRGSRTKENYDINTTRIIELDKIRHNARFEIDRSFKVAQDIRFVLKDKAGAYNRMFEDLE